MPEPVLDAMSKAPSNSSASAPLPGSDLAPTIRKMRAKINAIAVTPKKYSNPGLSGLAAKRVLPGENLHLPLLKYQAHVFLELFRGYRVGLSFQTA